jgi:Bacterial Ig-like domain (group 2)
MRAYSCRCNQLQVLFLFLSLPLILASTGCAGYSTTRSPKTLTSISASPSTASIAVGATTQLAAMGTYSDGSTAEVTTTATWTSSTATVATVNSDGLVTGLSTGSTTITASLSGVSGAATLAVGAMAKTLTSIAVTPSTASISAVATQQFTATATYSDGSTAVITSTANWTSSTPATATINAAGLATAVAQGLTTITASFSGTSGAAALNVTGKTVLSLAITSGAASFAMGSTQQFTATATYSDNSTANVTSTSTWTVANTAVATIDATGLATAVASGSTSVTAEFSSVSGVAAFMVTIVPGTGVNIPMWHVDTNRSGLNANEKSLTTTNVTTGFGKLFSYAVDGYAYAEPLLMSNVTINGAAHNVIYVATEHDSVYAFDADNYGSGAPLWQVSLLNSNETPMTDGPIQPYQGVTSTPVIDPSSNTLYVVSAQDLSGTSTFRLNALDISTGAPKFGGPITIVASVPGTNSDSVNNTVSLTTSCIQRAALLLANGNVYVGFGSCHSGWLLAYSASTLAQVGVFNASPNLNGEGTYASAGGVWMGGGGPAADSSGNIYITTGNGPWNPAQGAYGDSVLKFSPTLTLEDYFTPDDYQYMDCNDADLAAGGLILIPGSNPIQALAGGKTGMMYLVNTSNMGHETAGDTGVTQELFWGTGILSPYSSECTDVIAPYQNNTAMINSYEIFGTSAYFNGSVYLGVTPTAANLPIGIQQFTYSGGTLGPVTDDTLAPYVQQDTRGTSPFVSANGTSDGIVWMIDQGLPLQNTSGTTTTATLRAYDATNLADELYNSGMNVGDVPGYGIKFSSPIVANGKVYMSTGHDPVTTTNPQGEIDVYGLK